MTTLEAIQAIVDGKRSRGTFPAAALSIEVARLTGMTEANWHGKSGDNRRQASSKGYDVGRNHETGKKIVEMAKDHYGLEVRCKHPLRKCWSGRDGKITHGELMSLLEGSRVTCARRATNQEERDAALLALDASGIAMRMKREGL